MFKIIEHDHTRKKILVKVSVVHILGTERSLCLFTENLSPVILHVFLLSFIAVPKHLHDVLVSEPLKVAEHLLELLMTTISMCGRVVVEHLDSNLLPIFMYTL